MPLRLKRRKGAFARLLARAWERVRPLGSRIAVFWRRFTGDFQRRALLAQLEPGDIILAAPPARRLSPVALAYRLLLRAKYVHSMLYLGRGRIIHTTSRYGIVVGRIPRGIYRKDRYTILRVPDLSIEQQRRLVEEALRWQGRRLDATGLVSNIPRRLFGLPRAEDPESVDRVWCSKFVVMVFRKVGIELVPEHQLGSVTSEDLAASRTLRKVR